MEEKLNLSLIAQESVKREKERIEARRLTPELNESRERACGIFYVTPSYPGNSWKISVFTEKDYGPVSHMEVWARYLSVEVFNAWKDHVTVSEKVLKEQIKDCPYAFPRGRVELVPEGPRRGYKILHGRNLWDDAGNSLAPFNVRLTSVQRLFGLENSVDSAGNVVAVSKLLYDDHERCDRSDALIACKLLGIEQDWEAARISSFSTRL